MLCNLQRLGTTALAVTKIYTACIKPIVDICQTWLGVQNFSIPKIIVKLAEELKLFHIKRLTIQVTLLVVNKQGHG